MAKICRRTGKVNYRSVSAAVAALRKIAATASMKRTYGKVEIEWFKCLFCPYWHLTSQEQHNRNDRGQG